jgi:hypothetical protein
MEQKVKMVKKVLLLFCLVCSSSSLNAAVITNSNITLQADGIVGRFSLTVYQNEAGTNPTSIWFDHEGTNLILRGIGINLDKGSNWYFANYGDAFGPTTIDSGSFVLFSLLETFNVGYGDFYFGVSTGESVFPSDYDVFGWAKLRNSSSGVELLGSAVAYDSGGIIIGTTTIVPEPSAIFLFGTGFMLLKRRRLS